MAMPESQLETWANLGNIIEAKSTADSVKNKLKSSFLSGLLIFIFIVTDNINYLLSLFIF